MITLTDELFDGMRQELSAEGVRLESFDDADWNWMFVFSYRGRRFEVFVPQIVFDRAAGWEELFDAVLKFLKKAAFDIVIATDGAYRTAGVWKLFPASQRTPR